MGILVSPIPGTDLKEYPCLPPVFAVIVDGNVRLLLKVRVIIPINVPEIVKFQDFFIENQLFS